MIVRTASWHVTSPELPRAAFLCWDHMRQLRRQRPEVSVHFLLDLFTEAKGCDLCVAGVPITTTPHENQSHKTCATNRRAAA